MSMTAMPKPHGIKGKPKGGQGGWTPQKCLQQSAKLRAQKIWLASTGPRTAAGKQKSSLNACKPGHEQRRAERLQTQRVRSYLRLNSMFLDMYLHARKAWADLPDAHKLQTFQSFAHLKNELGILEAQICQALEKNRENVPQTTDPPLSYSFGT